MASNLNSPEYVLLGYVEKVILRKESHTGHRFCSALVVIGLTDAGRELVAPS